MLQFTKIESPYTVHVRNNPLGSDFVCLIVFWYRLTIILSFAITFLTQGEIICPVQIKQS